MNTNDWPMNKYKLPNTWIIDIHEQEKLTHEQEKMTYEQEKLTYEQENLTYEQEKLTYEQEKLTYEDKYSHGNRNYWPE